MRNKAYKVIAVIGITSLLLTGCNKQSKETESTNTTAIDTEASTIDTDTEESINSDLPTKIYDGMSAKEITDTLTLEQKANQMVIPAIYNVRADAMETTNYGSVLSTNGFVTEDANEWRSIITNFQTHAMENDAPIPFIYGQDSVHGVNYCAGTVIFPHNINIGMANDEELTYEMGLAVADEMKLSGLIWNYAPCVAVSKDPRWGRTYESYSADTDIVKKLGTSYTKGLLEGQVMVCAKHYIGDGFVVYGTGEKSDKDRLIDRGNAVMTDEEIDAQLDIYKSLIDEGAQSIMISHSALNGIKMHENKEYITDVLRGELGFDGVIVSDWNSIQNIDSTKEYKEQICISVNAGIDWLMKPDTYDDCAGYIVELVNEGKIKETRIDEAVTKIIQFKLDAGLFKDPYLANVSTKQDETGSTEYRQLASQLVSKSQVLIKNDNDILPFKAGTKIYVCGPAANDTGVQCGGWTKCWDGKTDISNRDKVVGEGTTILEALENIKDEYDLTIITDESKRDEADVVLLCVGEKPYAEWNGDTEDLSITGDLALDGNEEAIKEAKDMGKPTVTLLVTGRNVIIKDYVDSWDSIVMSGLFGSEGEGVADVLVGKEKFTGKLAMPWYDDVDKINSQDTWLDIGYGL